MRLRLVAFFRPRFACENFSTESRCDTVDFSRCLNLSRRVNVGLRKYLRDQHEKRTGWKQETLNFSAKLSDFEVSRKLPLSVYIYLRRDGMLNLQNGFPLGTWSVRVYHNKVQGMTLWGINPPNQSTSQFIRASLKLLKTADLCWEFSINFLVREFVEVEGLHSQIFCC